MLFRSYDGTQIQPSPYSGLVFRSTENYTTTSIGSKIELWAVPNGSNTRQLVTTFNPSDGYKGIQLPISNSGILFSDGSFQTTAFNSSNAVTSVTVGTGLTQTNTTGAVGIDATGVLSVSGTNNQVIVANVGQNITLSTPQNLNTNATVQFNTLTVQNLNIKIGRAHV